MMTKRLHIKENSLGYLIGGLIVLVLGIMVLVPSVLEYWDTLNAKRSLKERAAEMGLGDIPGVNLDDTLRFILMLIVFGGAISIAGSVLVACAFLLGRE